MSVLVHRRAKELVLLLQLLDKCFRSNGALVKRIARNVEEESA